jgi:uncharacterized protein YbjT (DUF2867 family)
VHRARRNRVTAAPTESTVRTAAPPYGLRVSAPIVVTGATGTVGRPLVELLRATGAAVRPASRHPRDPDAVAFDFLDRSTRRAPFDGVESMFLLRPPDLTRVSRDLAPPLAFAQVLGLRHVVLLSVQGAGKVPVLPHAAVERWLRRSGLSWTFVRPSYFDQNLSGVFAADIRDRNQIVVPAGGGRAAFVDAHDVAAVAAAALLGPREHAGRAWTPTGPALTCDEIAVVLSDELGRRIRYQRPGLVAYARHAHDVLGLPPAMVAVTAALPGTARLGLAGFETGDVAAATGRPPTTFAEFAHRERAAWVGGPR